MSSTRLELNSIWSTNSSPSSKRTQATRSISNIRELVINLDALGVRTQICNSNQTTGGLSSSLVPELMATPQILNRITTTSSKAGFTNSNSHNHSHSNTKTRGGLRTETLHKHTLLPIWVEVARMQPQAWTLMILISKISWTEYQVSGALPTQTPKVAHKLCLTSQGSISNSHLTSNQPQAQLAKVQHKVDRDNPDKPVKMDRIS